MVDIKDIKDLRGKYFYAKDHEFTKTINEVPNTHLNKIIQGDSEQILKELPSNCIDLVFTSPPYNFDMAYESTEDNTDWPLYFGQIFKIFNECIRVLKYGGRIVVNIQPSFSDYVPTHHIIGDYFMKNKMIWKGEIIWNKNNYNCPYTCWGSWKSPSSPYLKYQWEFLEVFCKGSIRKDGNTDDIDITAEDFKKLVTARWDIAPEKGMSKYGHPAMFPKKLAANVLQLFSFKNDIVLDPFNGAGTTTCMAKALGRKYIGIDISEEYCRTAEERLSQFLFGH